MALTSHQKNKTRLQLFQDVVELDEIECIVRMQVKKAKDGDSLAYDRVMDGRFGKMKENTEPAVVILTDSQAEIAARFAARVKGK